SPHPIWRSSHETSSAVQRKIKFNLALAGFFIDEKYIFGKTSFMRKILLFLSVLAISCASKQTRNSLLSGDYDEAIETATESLKRDRDKKSKQDLVYMLEEAFAKAKERDLRNIDLWKKEKNPANYQKIYNTYVQLESRQEKIRPLLPLKLLDRNRNAHFPFDDYSKEIVKSKANLVEYLYANSQGLLNSSNK